MSGRVVEMNKSCTSREWTGVLKQDPQGSGSTAKWCVGYPGDVTTSPTPTVTLPLVFPFGRVVSVSNLLTGDEARDVIILQRGATPLRPMPLDVDLYEGAQSGSMPMRLVLAELFTSASALIVNELQASVLTDTWLESVDPRTEP